MSPKRRHEKTNLPTDRDLSLRSTPESRHLLPLLQAPCPPRHAAYLISPLPYTLPPDPRLRRLSPALAAQDLLQLVLLLVLRPCGEALKEGWDAKAALRASAPGSSGTQLHDTTTRTKHHGRARSAGIAAPGGEGQGEGGEGGDDDRPAECGGISCCVCCC